MNEHKETNRTPEEYESAEAAAAKLISLPKESRIMLYGIIEGLRLAPGNQIQPAPQAAEVV